MSHRVLIVDDEAGIRQALKQVLEYENLEVRVASSGGEAISLYSEFRPHLVFLDVKMAGLDGLETLTRLHGLDGAAQIVMISGHGTIATAVEATQRGAFDFLEKPLDSDRLLLTVRNALAHGQLAGENARLREVTESRYQMVGSSPALQRVRELIDKVGPTGARVLITGDNGTGKELVARGLHEASPRRGKAFVEVNCAAIPSELIESELFGHMKGSFTGALADRAGKFEQADGGTLFLDEVGDMSLPAQAKLLRVLQEGVVTRIGGSKSIQVDVRVLAATNKDLESEIGEGTLSRGPAATGSTSCPSRYRHCATGWRISRLWWPISPSSSPRAPACRAESSPTMRCGGCNRARGPATFASCGTRWSVPSSSPSGKVVTAADIDRLLPVAESAAGGAPGPAGHTFETFKQEAERKFLAQQLASATGTSRRPRVPSRCRARTSTRRSNATG